MDKIQLFSFLDGSLTLHGLSLTPDALKKLSWHLECRQVTIASVFIQIAWPWRARGSLRVRVAGLSIALFTRSIPQPISPEAKKQQELRTAQRSNDPKLAAVDRLLLMHPARLSLPWNFGILLRAVLVQSTSTVMASQHYKAFLELKVLSKNLLGSRRQAGLAQCDAPAFQYPAERGPQCASQLVQPLRVFSSHCVGKCHGALFQQRMHEGDSTDQGQLDHIPER
ncbi:hypothetical protein WJX75_003700 [Coccomyxa subellipsoidea]|uniref:Uncharacterized protein n=1 Tax=Coccomyxa subellipsoidea TaxID=248742 RepID=A0ABR2YVC0_9CHLO